MDSGRKRLFHRANPEPVATGFGNMRSLPAPSHNSGPQPRLKEWVEPAPEPAFGYDSSYEEEEHDLLEGLPAWDPKPPKKARRKKRNPYGEDRGMSHTDISEEALLDSWIEQRRSGNSAKPRQRKSGTTAGTKKRLIKTRAPAKKAQVKTSPPLEEEDLQPDVENKPKRKNTAKKSSIRDEEVDEADVVEVEPKKVSRKKTGSGRKKQPALIARALETQEKIEEKKAGLDPSILEEKGPRPKREKIVQSYDML
jgi:hypothetical protein